MTTVSEIIQKAVNNKKYLHDFFFKKDPLFKKKLSSYEKHELNALLLLTLESPAELCRFLKTSFLQLEEIINNPSYSNHSIRKKKGGERQIYAPDKNLKRIQKRLNYFFQAYYLLIKPNEVNGFVVNPHYSGKECNIVENAKNHCRKKQVLNIDLKDFFPSISASQVKEVFTSDYFNFNESIAIALTFLTTYQGKLPIGAPTSPVISNFICFKLDNDLKEFCSKNGLSYSRYADDLTFSSDSFIPIDTVLDLINVIKQNHFQINDKKLRLKSSNRKQTVTGLTVNDKVNVDRKLLKKIRAMLHDLKMNGIEKAAQKHFKIKGEVDSRFQGKFIQRLEGYINFVGQVRGKTDSLYVNFKSIYQTFSKVIST
jgi:RNA-directed DNA polymerase